MTTKLLKDDDGSTTRPARPPADEPIVLEAGVAIVPSKPTAAMLAAGARAGGVTVEVAWRVYQAMVGEAG